MISLRDMPVAVHFTKTTKVAEDGNLRQTKYVFFNVGVGTTNFILKCNIQHHRGAGRVTVEYGDLLLGQFGWHRGIAYIVGSVVSNDINNTYSLCVNAKDTLMMGSGLELAYTNASTSTCTVSAVKCNYNPNMILATLTLNIASFVITANDLLKTDTMMSVIYRPVVTITSLCVITIDGIDTVCKISAGVGGKITISPLTTNFTIGQTISFIQVGIMYSI